MKKTYIAPEMTVEKVEINCILNLQSGGGSAKANGIKDADAPLRDFDFGDFEEEDIKLW